MSAAVAGGSPDARRRRSRGYRPERMAACPEEDGVKVESDVDIKDYAETTMNELLGWYGYDKLDSRGVLSNIKTPLSSSTTSSPSPREDFSEEDTSRSSPRLDAETAAQIPNGSTIICAWCLKTGLKLFTLKTSSGKTKAFCSEPCFNQCRRAAFKKNRICNWCRHVRHTVNYVDFKDGDDQLQFCSDKCLNQYKMQIFCKETQAYLQMNPHLQEESKQSGAASSKLITPDLWLRDCQEPANGGAAVNMSHSEDEQTPQVEPAAPKTVDDECVEDLTISSSKLDSCSPLGRITPALERDRLHEIPKAVVDSAPVLKRKPSFDMCNTLASYLRDDRDKTGPDRKKRYYENDRDHFRKRQKTSSMRSRSNHPPEAPPAHLSSIHPALLMPNRLLHQSPYTPSLNLNSNSLLIPPAAHSKAPSSHASLTGGSLVTQRLPQPSSLLNNEFLHHSPLSSPFFTPTFSPQQHVDAALRMQAGMRPGEHFPPPHMFQESMLPFTRTSSHSTPYMQPNTVMLPYPVFVPLPVPIPIPIPLTGFLSKYKKLGTDDQKTYNGDPISSENGDILNVDSDSDSFSKANNNSKSDTRELPLGYTSQKVNQTVDSSTYAVKNNDSFTNRLILTRNKNR